MAQAATSPGRPAGNHLSLKELCCLFCCPPCPSNIVSKLAFMPPEPTYKFIPDDSASRFSFHLLPDKAEWPYSRAEFDRIEAFYAQSSRGNRIACIYVKCCADARYTLLFSHGNAVDLGQMSSFYYGLGSRLNCNVFSYDYSGYGASNGRPSEKNLYADITAAWNALLTHNSLSPDSVILYGQSIGTVPTVDLASRFEAAAVVLHSPLMSGLRVAFPDTKRSYWCDKLVSIDKVPKIMSQTLIIHGTEDEVIDFSHGLSMYEKCPRAVDPLWVNGAGHNDVEMHSAYLDRLKHFIDYEIAGSHNNGQNSTANVKSFSS